MTLPAKSPVEFRHGDPLQIAGRRVPFGRHILLQKGSVFSVQHPLFVNDPWELIAEAIHRAVPKGKTRDIAHSFRRQAEDYFRAATLAGELAVRPVLLYYAFLNLSKAFAIARGNTKLAGRAVHGIGFPYRKPRAIAGAAIAFDVRKRPAVFEELLQHLDGDPMLLASDLQLGNLLPQILPGHRLWCYAAKRSERFLTVEDFWFYHSPARKQVWLNLYVNRSDMETIGLSETEVLSQAGLASRFELLPSGISLPVPDWIGFQQTVPTAYISHPAEAASQILRSMRNALWETVRLGSPYRKRYIYCSPIKEHGARIPQLLSVYLLMFFLSSATRYFAGYFEELLESRYGPFFGTFISESPMQFLYLMASDIIGQEVSKPAII